jgi:transcriptional regulator with XRE-family HTH domain
MPAPAPDEREPDNMTQSEVAALLQLSPQRIGQIERSALAKIRKAIASGEFPALAEAGGSKLAQLVADDRRERKAYLKRHRESNRRRGRR